ncbi:DegV family protein [Candidatus Cryosericum septentrionale]|jgi:DegV family protein with EDD domain|nr:DegV family protein [Candidatus Cryosericum septentrionale]
MAIHIVTDSTSYLPTGFAEQHDLPVVPLKVSVDGIFFREFVEISADVFYAKQKAGAKSGTTQPGPEDFITVYTKLLAKPDDEVLSIHLSAAMSGTLNSAYIAAEQTDPRRIHLYDVRTSGLGLGFMVMQAVKLVAGGAGIDGIITMLDGMQPRTHIYFLVGTMKYLVEGGRVGKAAGVAAGILQIKPILTVKDGIVDVFERPRTMRTARDHMWAIIDQAVVRGIEHIGFHYAGNRAEVEAMRTEFTRRTGIPSVLSQLGPCIGCHTGPEAMAVVIVDKAV